MASEQAQLHASKTASRGAAVANGGHHVENSEEEEGRRRESGSESSGTPRVKDLAAVAPELGKSVAVNGNGTKKGEFEERPQDESVGKELDKMDDQQSTPVGMYTPSGVNTPYSTSMGSISSYSSGAEGYPRSEGGDTPFDVSEGVRTSPRKSHHTSARRRKKTMSSEGSRRELTQEERDLFLRLEKEWQEEDAWSKQPGSWYSTLAWLPVLIWLRIINVFLSVVFWPMSIFSRVVFGTKVEYTPFWDVPLERRKQTAVVLFFVMLLPMVAFAYIWSIVLLLFPLTTIPMLAYYLFIFKIDHSPYNGSRRPFMRYWKLWRHFANYFPLRLIRTKPLDPERKYVFCYHPHGIISMGAFGCFATDAAGFSRKFPGIDLRLLTLQMNFWCPWLREFLLSMGLCSAAKKSCNQILQRGPGSAIMLVVGGAAESLNTEPGHLRLTLGRKGFVRVALDNGADLVPCLAFGENEIFSTMYYPQGSFARTIQEKIRRKLGFATPIFSGRGIFQYNMGILPYRKPIIVVVGPPVRLDPCPEHLKGHALSTTAEGKKRVNDAHQKYVEALRELWDLYKERWAIHRQGSLIVQQN